MILIEALIYLKTLQQIAYFLYVYQLKEYRIDRTREHLDRKFPSAFIAWTHLTLLAPISTKMLPRPTAKVLLIAVLAFGLYNGFLLINKPVVLIMGLFLSPLIALASQALQFPLEQYMKARLRTQAHEKIQRLKEKGLRVIGITGSYGKTSTKHLLTHALGLSYNVITTPGSVNTPIAISKIILNQLTEEHEFFVVEMGAYKRGEIQQLVDIVDPNVGIITGISNQHIALFGSQENIIKGKSELLYGPSIRSIFINKASEYRPLLPKGAKPTMLNASTYETFTKGLTLPHLPDSFKINIGVALTVAHAEGVKISTLKKAIHDMYKKYCDVRELKGYNGSSVINRAFRGRSPLSSNRIGAPCRFQT